MMYHPQSSYHVQTDTNALMSNTDVHEIICLAITSKICDQTKV